MDGPISGLEFVGRYYFLAILTVIVSGGFVFFAAIDVVTERFAFARWEIPVAVRVFIASASLFPFWFVLSLRIIPWQIRFRETVRGLDLEGLVSISVSSISLACLLFSTRLLQQTSGPGTRVSKIGSKVLTVAYIFNLVGLLTGYLKTS